MQLRQSIGQAEHNNLGNARQNDREKGTLDPKTLTEKRETTKER